MNEREQSWMERALELAERGRGYVEPNPLVGAVVVANGQIIGEGWHEKYGQAHAEVNALTAAGQAARGATLYVTLEPCCHHGKTPPCTEAILRAGVGRVVAAMLDPFPQVSGQGAALLRERGLTIDVGLCEAQARHLNAPYLKLLATGRPYVHVKWAMTLDGKICTRSGDAKWISNEASRRHGHALRGCMDGIVVGIGTALADDPLLTTRPSGPRVATRIVMDSQCRLPVASRLVQTACDAPVLIASAEGTGALEHARNLREHGAEVLAFPGSAGRPAVGALLDELGRRRMTNILVEGGSAVLGSFFDAGAMDEIHVFIAPLLVGGTGKTPVDGRGVERIAEALRVGTWQMEMIAGDVYLHGRR